MPAGLSTDVRRSTRCPGGAAKAIGKAGATGSLLAGAFFRPDDPPLGGIRPSRACKKISLAAGGSHVATGATGANRKEQSSLVGGNQTRELRKKPSRMLKTARMIGDKKPVKGIYESRECAPLYTCVSVASRLHLPLHSPPAVLRSVGSV